MGTPGRHLNLPFSFTMVFYTQIWGLVHDSFFFFLFFFKATANEDIHANDYFGGLDNISNDNVFQGELLCCKNQWVLLCRIERGAGWLSADLAPLPGFCLCGQPALLPRNSLRSFCCSVKRVLLHGAISN
jgi:hypothetical protein